MRVEYLGKQVACEHCGAGFEACDPDSEGYPPSDSGILLLRRVEELLAAAEGAATSTAGAESSAIPNKPR